ncbi:MFS transporter [Parasphingorhabdus sp. JC815]|uniref:MFS transporter n=1 Tax=Parasphingorhabdus sp. JC815 TaxID=3232140 RepID=UPI0034589B11
MASTQVTRDEGRPSIPAKHRKFYGWNNAALLFFIQFASSGFVTYAYAAVFPAMVVAMDWDRGDASIAHSLNFLMIGIAYPVTGWMIGKWGVRFTLTTGLMLVLIGLLLTVLLVTQVWHWILIWGFLIGAAGALAGPLCWHTVVIHWFDARRATVLGIMLTGSALGGFVAQPVLMGVMDSFGTWQSGWLVSAAAVGAAVLLTRFIINRPHDIGQYPDDIDPRDAKDRNQKSIPTARTYRSAHNWTLKEVFRSYAVYLAMIISITYLGVGTFLLTHGALYFSDIGISSLQTASIISMFILGNGMGRMPAGWLGDRIELRWLMAAIMTAMLIGFIMLWALQYPLTLALSAFILGSCYGGLFALTPALTSNFFGQGSFAKINSVLAPLLLPFVAIAPAGAGYIFDIYGSYDRAFMIGTILLIMSVIAAVCLKPPRHMTVANTV